MDKSIHGDNRGLTLIELLIGVSILAVIVVPLLAVFLTGASTSWKSHNYGNATTEAQNLVEQIEASDIDDILVNAAKVHSGARFYVKSSGEGENAVYNEYGIAAPAAQDNKYYIGASDITLGGSEYDALITLDKSSSVNDTDVSVSNQMDALIGMTGADSSALTALRTEFGAYFDDPEASLTLSGISRTITMTVTKNSNYYDISTVFTYSGYITYPYLTKTKTEAFSYSDTGSSRISAADAVPEGKPIFSIYMLFNAYYSDKDMITINNLAGGDFNVFIADVTESPDVSATYTCKIMYKSQYDNTAQRVFTNIDPAHTIYRAFDIKSPAFYKTLPTSGELVETQPVDRKYSVQVSLFNSGSGFAGNPIASFGSSKLD